ncbi:GNAT family N-acetyltransferase [Celeribacter sp. PS-C1]|uniref:GNAT family N-acetyltransferase n=1 Tax=Celeribacter sp. PS-C1 TaxID=2820813 RepID=UPI001C66C99D|nr:GNAT family N-acetyltransferase [Celeribacter sp. PS-C1]MBW6416706.1 GNAT family N-acetyltransferase [Celeribacter sp. PS-C1]
MSERMIEDKNVILRRADHLDTEAITALVRAAFGQYTPLIGKPPAPALYDYAALIETGRVRVAVCGVQIVGVIYTYPEQDGGVMLDVLAVSEAARGRGIAMRLILEAEARARRDGASLMRVYTNAVMAGPQRLYPKLGYTETHRGESDGYQRIHYEKRL